MDRSKALGEEKISVLLWRFSVPAMVGMVVNALYNIVDSVFVGNWVGETGLAAVTIAFPIMLILMGVGMLIGIGASTLISIRLGERKKQEAEEILGNALAMIVGAVILLTVLLLAFLDPILVLLGADEKILPYARDFTRIIVAGSLFMHIGFGLNNIIRAEGNPKVAMATMLISAVLNTILNPLFIIVFHLGIGGSALATVVSQAVSAVWVLAYFLGEKSTLKLRWRNVRLHWDIVSHIAKMGFSPFMMQIAASLVTLLLNFALLRYGGELAIAAAGVINRVGMLVLMPIFGINQGVQPIIGYNYGAGSYLRVREALKLGIYFSTALCTVGFVFAQVLAAEIIAGFNQNTALIELGAHGLRVMCAVLPVIGFQVVGAGYFLAVGKAGIATLLSLSRQVILLMPLLLILPGFFGLEGVWIATPAADLGSALLTAWLLYFELDKLKVKNDPELERGR